MNPKERHTIAHGTCSAGKLVQELQDLKKRYPGQVEIFYFVDAEGSYITPSKLKPMLQSSFDDCQNYHSDQPPSDAATLDQPAAWKPTPLKLIMISGPDGFINYFAGPKMWEGAREVQGPVRGVLGALGAETKGWQIWKL
jgi:homoaconitate hydratase